MWATSDQPPGRWHDTGEGPCHYLSNSAKAAWAEIVRHEGITNVEDLGTLLLTLWEVEVPDVFITPPLGNENLTGSTTSYPLCREVARRVKADGVIGLRAPSAAVLSGEVEVFACSSQVEYVIRRVPAESLTLFGQPDDLQAMPDAEGHPDPTVLNDVRYL